MRRGTRSRSSSTPTRPRSWARASTSRCGPRARFCSRTSAAAAAPCSSSTEPAANSSACARPTATTWWSGSAAALRSRRLRMRRRALIVVALALPVLAWSWLRLETGTDSGQAALVVLLAATARRPGLVALFLVVGVGWPGTLLPGRDLLRGGLLLAAVLACTTVLRRGPLRGLGAAVAAGSLVMVAAVAASSSPALAKQAFLDWQRWDLYTKPAKPVDVSYVWDSSYRRLVFRGKPTTVFRVKAGAQSHYWRVSVLNTVEEGRWFEELATDGGEHPLIGEPGLVPPRERRRSAWERQQVTVEALRDHRLP